VVGRLHLLLVIAAIATPAAGCDENKTAAQRPTPTVAASTEKPPAPGGEEGEYYVIAYMHCDKKLKALATAYGTVAEPEPVAKAHAAGYGAAESRGAYLGCLDAIGGLANKVWSGK
jgi:hypothetical protein